MKPISQENSKLGFVGIGCMGRPIVRKLLESGFKVTAYDRDHSKSEELIHYGDTVAQSISELASSCNVLLSCLPSDEAVLSIYRGPSGVFANARPGLLVIDLSTVYPLTSKELTRLSSEHGVEVLDVTISGSTPAAENALLTLFGGGNKECFEAAESIFRVSPRNTFILGPAAPGRR
jgi:3-hydroxyisobutyrate dehydrogenase-like beta-hydroxyacid dehydrogenase